MAEISRTRTRGGSTVPWVYRRLWLLGRASSLSAAAALVRRPAHATTLLLLGLVFWGFCLRLGGDTCRNSRPHEVSSCEDKCLDNLKMLCAARKTVQGKKRSEEVRR
jgi:hypothetical protein